MVLKHDSLAEITANVSQSTGHSSLAFPPSPNDRNRWIFAFYQKLSLHQNVVYTSTQSGSIFDNGSYVVDHYSSEGARTVIRFWEEHILGNGLDALLKKAGNYGKYRFKLVCSLMGFV
jgi:hypothetical protein